MRARHRFFVFSIVALLGVILAAHAAVYWPFLSDDALISLRYAQRWAAGHGITWTDHERVEGYTDFLWVALTALAGRIGFDFISAARALDFVGAASAIVFLGLSVARRSLARSRLLTGSLFLVTAPPIAVWSIGGLEHGFMAGVLAAAFYTLEGEPDQSPKYAAWSGVLLAALCLLRADGLVLVACLLGGAAASQWRGRSLRLSTLRRLLWIALPSAAAVLGQFTFRYFYYGALQPNTALAKVAIGKDRLLLGAEYVASAYAAMPLLIVAALYLTYWVFRQGAVGGNTHSASGAPHAAFNSGPLMGWSVVVGWSLYQVVVGGDIFPGWRQMVFVVVALCYVVSSAAEHAPTRALNPLAIAAVVILNLVVGARNPENRRASSERWEWDGLPIGHLLKVAFGKQQPLLAVDAAGALPYWSELPSLDMLGLNDRYIALHPPKDFGKGGIGHELGDGAYVLRRKPDVIAFNNAAGSRDPIFLSGRQMLGTREFAQHYQWIRVRGSIGNRAFGELWIRRDGGKVGIHKREHALEIPGYLFTGQGSDAVAELDGQGRLVASVPNTTPGVLPALRVPAGRYRVRFFPEREAFTADFRCGGASMDTKSAAGPYVLELPQLALLDIAIASQHNVALASAELVEDPLATPTHTCAGYNTMAHVTEERLLKAAMPGSFWAHPQNVVFTARGLSIQLKTPRALEQLELSVDNNDAHTIRALSAGRVVTTANIGPTPRPGMAVHRIPFSSKGEPIDTITIVPTEGDNAYSIGHLVLSN